MYLPPEADQMYVCGKCGEVLNKHDTDRIVLHGENFCLDCVEADKELDDEYQEQLEERKQAAKDRYENDLYDQARDAEIEERANVRQA